MVIWLTDRTVSLLQSSELEPKERGVRVRATKAAGICSTGRLEMRDLCRKGP